MFIFGDIGNSEAKVFLVSSNNRIIKNINFPSNEINEKILNSKFKFLYYKLQTTI